MMKAEFNTSLSNPYTFPIRLRVGAPARHCIICSKHVKSMMSFLEHDILLEQGILQMNNHKHLVLGLDNFKYITSGSHTSCSNHCCRKGLCQLLAVADQGLHFTPVFVSTPDVATATKADVTRTYLAVTHALPSEAGLLVIFDPVVMENQRIHVAPFRLLGRMFSGTIHAVSQAFHQV